MSYTTKNFKTKKQLKEAIANGERVTLQQEFIGPTVENGTTVIEGPHSPEPHRWYAKATIENGRVVKVS